MGIPGPAEAATTYIVVGMASMLAANCSVSG